PFSNHNGGHIEFSPVDGFLYIGIGDGGSGNDPFENSLDKMSLLGKLLRLDVSPTDGSYDIPPGNIQDGAPEVFDWGLRNPYRWSFDICTGDRYIADVGQNAREEIDFGGVMTGATNWGWSCKEGDIDGPNSGCDGSEVGPIYTYPHSMGNSGASITGGYVYRGAVSWLRGAYFFADYVDNTVSYFRYDGAPLMSQDVTMVGSPGTYNQIIGSGQDNRGEVYFTSQGGTVYRVAEMQ
ncbi:MAG: PQQ-dependent sugar dehydrogenase, partial [Myxococcales bacterium]|nr:PQQ-dependent sugar dehydrogenase [Myxococcales bacterium]